MYYVYYLRSIANPHRFYTGYSEDLQARLVYHNEGRVKSTKPYRPWSLIFYEAFACSADAKCREGYLKTTQGRRMLHIILKQYLAT